MNKKELIGWSLFFNAFVSMVSIVYLNMNYGWFYPYRDNSMLIPIVLVVIGVIFMFSSIENPWKHVLCDKCKTPVAISCTGYIHCVKCDLGNEDFWYSEGR